MTEPASRVRLDATPADIVTLLPDLGRLMLVGQGSGVTHERIGLVESVWARTGMASLSGAMHDSELLTMRVDRVILDCSMTMKDKVYPRLEFLDADGVRLANVVGMEGLEPFETALEAIARLPEAASGDKPDLPDGKAPELADDDPVHLPFDAAIAAGCPLVIEFRNGGLRQRWQGVLEQVRPMMGHLNVITPDFHLHLKGGSVAEWRVQPGTDGPSLAAIGPDGAPTGLSLRTERLADLGVKAPGFRPHPAGTWIAPDDGAPLAHAGVIAEAAQGQVVLLGETHDRADIHRWQLHVAAGLLAHRSDIALGFEMFPRRVQPALDAWVAGDLSEADFLAQSEWSTVWGFPPELYLPLFRFCREFRLPMLALNCRRALVTEVGKQGWDAIPEAGRDGLTPAKDATPEYRRYLLNISGGGAAGPEVQDPMDPAWDRFVRAQQCWDRAFACNIARALDRPDPPLVVGIVGRGHLEWGHGTPFQLADLGITNVTTLLPTHAPEFNPAEIGGIARAMFRLPR